MPRAILGLVVLVVVSLSVSPEVRGADAGGFKVVVHATNSLASIEARELSQLFLKRTTRWPGGGVVLPLDQPTSSAVREKFSQQVLSKPPLAMEAYWTKLLFSGQGTPPLMKSNDREVLAYVRDNSGAVGYVATDAPSEAGTKVLAVTGLK